MSFDGWHGDDIARLLEDDGFQIPPGTTDEELRIFAEEQYGGPENLDQRLGNYFDDDAHIEEESVYHGPTPAGSFRSTFGRDDLDGHDAPIVEVSNVEEGDHAFPIATASSAAILPVADDDEKGGAQPVSDAQPTSQVSGPQHRRGFASRARQSGGGQSIPGWTPRDDEERRRNDLDDEARYDLEVGAVYEDNFAEPKIEAAREYANLHHPRTMDGRPYPLCGATMGRLCFASGPIGVGFDWLGEGAVSEMARYGSGMSLHFKTLKFLFWMFLFATCLSLPQIVLNSQNVEYGGGLFVTTIGNLFPFSNRSYVFLCASSSATNGSASYLCRYSLPELSFIYAFTNLSIILLFTAGILWVHYFVEREPQHVAKLFLSLDRYSVWVPHVPKGCGEIPLAQYFEETTGEMVDEVNIAYDEGELITLFKDRGDVLSELWRATGRAMQVARSTVKSTALRSEEEMLDLKAERLERVVDYYDLLLSTYHSLNEETRGFSKGGANAISAVVTFETQEGVLRALEMFKKSRAQKKNSKIWPVLVRFAKTLKKLACVLCFSPGLAAKPSEIPMNDDIPEFQGMHLTCEPASPPSTILWENLEFSYCSRMLRQLLATALVIVAIGASFGASFGSQAYRAELKLSRLSECNDTFIVSVASTAADECTCARYAFARASSAIFETSDPCHVYWYERAPLFAFTLFATGVVAFVNFVVTHVTISLAQFERHHSLMSTELSVASRLFVAYAINTAFVYVIVNILLGNSPNVYEPDANWYSDVGVQILITMLLNVVTPHLVTFYEVFTVRFKQTFGDKPLLQRELNERYVGGEFPFAVRSAQIFLQTFVCLVFGPGMPLLYPIATLSLAIFYWVDKWSVLRFYRTPPEYDSRMAELLIIVVWLSLLGNALFSIWTYSSPGLFWRGDEGASSSSGAYVITRASLPHTVPLFIVFFLLLGLWFGTYTLCFTWKTVIRSPRKSTRRSQKNGEVIIELDVKDDLPPLYDAKDSGYLRGLKSYNILQNPVYRRAFGVPKSFCDDHSHVSSVLALPGGEVLPELPDEVRKAIEEY